MTLAKGAFMTMQPNEMFISLGLLVLIGLVIAVVSEVAARRNPSQTRPAPALRLVQPTVETEHVLNNRCMPRRSRNGSLPPFLY